MAVAAIDPEPGDEIVTTSITDMGALTPILYQGAIPVFADVDPRTCNVTAETIEARLSPRTRAIVVTHLFGNPCEMGPIMELAARRGASRSSRTAPRPSGARYDGRHVGTIGAIGCFSLQQGKHITTGEGGLVATDDEALARRMFLFINKAWGYGDAEARPLLPGAQLPHERAAGRRRAARSSPSSTAVVDAARATAARRLTEQLEGLARHRDALGAPGSGAHLLEVLP